jgi:putative tryptophan/tyrosine transport system substrate-binding protein
LRGENLAIEWRQLADSPAELPGLAAELAQLQVDVIITTGGTPPSLAAKEATRTIPIVMTTIGDPVGIGLVASLAHPGGNVTGLSIMAPTLNSKRLDILKEVVPGLSRVAWLSNPANATTPLNWREITSAGQILGIVLQQLDAPAGRELANAFEVAAREGCDAVLVQEDAALTLNRRQIVDIALQRHMPLVAGLREFADAGALVSYGPSMAALFRRAAYYVDRILKGTKPADLPVEQPREFEFVINIRTAQALGLTIPQHVLLQATEVIQ